MKKRIISVAVALMILCSVFSFSFAESNGRGKVYVSNIAFNDENGTVSEPVGGMNIYADAMLEREKGFDGGMEYVISILASENGKLIFFESTCGELSEEEETEYMKTPVITLPEDGVNLKVWAMITDKDYSYMVAPVAVLGSSEAAVNKITVGGVEVPLEEGKSEYDMTVYLKGEDMPARVKVYPRDLAAMVTDDVEYTDYAVHRVSVTSSNGANSNLYTLNINAYEVNNASLIGISYEYKDDEFVSEEINNFTPNTYEVNADVEKETASVPQVKAVPYNPGAKVEITQASSFPGKAVIKVTSPDGSEEETYTVNFRKIKSYVASEPTALTRADGGWKQWNSTQGYQGFNIKTETLKGTSGKSNGGYFYFKFDIPSGAEIVEAYVNAPISVASTGAGKEHVMQFYQHYDPTLTQDDMIDEATGKFITKDAHVGNFRGLHDDSDEYLLSRFTVKNPAGSTKVNYTIPLDVNVLNITDKGNLIIVPAKDSISEDCTSLVYIYNFSVTVKYVDESEVVSASEEMLTGYSLASAESYALAESGEKTAEAEIIWSTRDEENIINIKASAGTGVKDSNEPVLVKLLREGVDEADETKTNLEKYAYFCGTYPDEEGNAEHTFEFYDESGIYGIVFNSENMTAPAKGSIYVPSRKALNGLLEAVANEEVTTAELAEIIGNETSKIGLNGEIFNSVSNTAREEVAEYIRENIEESNIEGYVSAYKKALLIKGITGSEEAVAEEILNYCEDEIKLSDNELYGEFSELSKKAEVYSRLAGGKYESISQVENGFFSAVSLVMLKNVTSFNEIGSIIEKFGDYMGGEETISEYKALNRNLIAKVNLAMVERISSSDSIEDVLEKLAEEIKAAKKQQAAQQTPKPSGGNGGGGGGGSFVATPVTPPVPMEKVEENTPAKVFEDVSSEHWGFEAITNLYGKKIISGRSESIFAPDELITRAEFTKLAVAALGLYNENAACSFSDVDSSFWGYSYIASAVENKLVNGMEENKFGRDLNISRQDAAVILYRAKGWDAGKTEEVFEDDALIADYSKDALYTLKAKGVLSGYNNNIRPADSLTRAEAAQIIYKILSI